MVKKKYSPEQIVAMLRRIEVAIANNKPTPQACEKLALPNKATTAGARNMAD